MFRKFLKSQKAWLVFQTFFAIFISVPKLPNEIEHHRLQQWQVKEVLLDTSKVKGYNLRHKNPIFVEKLRQGCLF